MLLALLVGATTSCGGPHLQRVTGVVIAITSTTLNQVERFTIKDGDRRVTVVVDEHTDFAFAPSHLYEHRATGDPVTVEYERRDGELYAVSVDDA